MYLLEKELATRLIEAVVPDVNITLSLYDAFIKDAATVRAAS